MRRNRAIAIDGDSGSGKSTVGKLVARKLDFEFIDSGLLYRAATFIIIQMGFQEKEETWAEAVQKTHFSMKNGIVFINDKKVPLNLLRSKEVDSLVSPVSAVKEVRDSVNSILRNIASGKNVVMVGRDIGTVVLKDAFLKIYLTATLSERANRRYRELLRKGIKITFNEVFENLKSRDTIDSTRETAPLSVAEDAYVIDTTALTIDEVGDRIIQFVKGKEYALQNSTLDR